MGKYDKEIFSEIVKNSNNLTDICRNLGIGTTKGNRDTVKKYIDNYDLNTEHFYFETGNKTPFIKRELNDILIENSTYVSTSSLKERLYKEGLKVRECELCGQGEEWQGKQISLILDHINGINNDNRIENLRIVCPNCNATLDTHCGKNIKKSIQKKISVGYEKKERGDDNLTVSMRLNYQAKRKTERPSLEILISDIKSLGFSKTGLKYGVSDNTIRKWIKFYGYEPNKVKLL